MNLETHRACVEAMRYGKRLPGAVYVVRPGPNDLPVELWKTICRAETAARPDPAWNLLKIHTEQFAVTFLSYPDFDSDPHPALAEATKINVATGSVVRTDYRARPNPPILHRKETFVPQGDPRVPGFAALTKREEEAHGGRRSGGRHASRQTLTSFSFIPRVAPRAPRRWLCGTPPECRWHRVPRGSAAARFQTSDVAARSPGQRDSSTPRAPVPPG